MTLTNDGQMLGFELNGVPYFYVRNLQGDVVAVLDSNGTVVARYEYDAWGNHLYIMDSEIARINPIRYRGYYWDNATQLYYLQSRYYCPQLRRFISADVFLDTGVGILGTNPYIYCNNDPVNLWDPTGFAPQINLMPLLQNFLAGTPVFAIDDNILDQFISLGQRLINPNLEVNDLLKARLSTIDGASQYARYRGWDDAHVTIANSSFCGIYNVLTGEVNFTFPDGRVSTRGFTTGRADNMVNHANSRMRQRSTLEQWYHNAGERAGRRGFINLVEMALYLPRGIPLFADTFSAPGRMQTDLQRVNAGSNDFLFTPTRL